VCADIELVLFHDGEYPVSAVSHAVPRRIGPVKGYRWQLWERVGLPWHASRSKCDVLHSLANTTPPRARLPRVVTVHDVIPYLPDIADDEPRLAYHASVIPQAVRRAAMVVTDSECSRDDVARVFRVPLDRITVIPLAVGAEFDRPPAGEREVTRRRLGVARPYVLALGASARRKNTDGVLRVFKRIATQHQDLHLVVTGVAGPLERVLRARMNEYGVPADRVVLLPFVAADSRGHALRRPRDLLEPFELPRGGGQRGRSRRSNRRTRRRGSRGRDRDRIGRGSGRASGAGVCAGATVHMAALS
jgi:glycosyltransferase involved in cell wall biosynthesis